MTLGSLKFIPETVWAWGPAIIILGGLFFLARMVITKVAAGLNKVYDTAVKGFIESQQSQVKASESIASAMGDLKADIERQRQDRRSDIDRAIHQGKVLAEEVKSFGDTLKEQVDKVEGISEFIRITKMMEQGKRMGGMNEHE